MTQHARGGQRVGLAHEAGPWDRLQPPAGDESLHRGPLHVRGPRDLVQRVHLGRPCVHGKEREAKPLPHLDSLFAGKKSGWWVGESNPPSTTEGAAWGQVVLIPSRNFIPSRSPRSRTALKPA